MPDHIEPRLTNIEKKLDNIERALVTLARIEERLASHGNDTRRLEKDVTDHEQRLRAVEGAVAENGFISRRAERVFWMFLAVGLSVAARYL